jgi:hypothetical protein
MINRRERGIQPRVVIENRSRAVNISRGAKFLGYARKIDIFAMKLAVPIVEEMHETL